MTHKGKYGGCGHPRPSNLGHPTERGTTRRTVTVDYLTHLGPMAACSVIIPAGTRAVLVPNPGGGWAVDDVPLLIRLTGNSHDPVYRYCWLPDEAMTGEEDGTSSAV